MGGGSGPLTVGLEVVGCDQGRSWDFPAGVDLLDHAQGQRALAVHDFGRARLAAHQLGQITLLLLFYVHEDLERLDRIERLDGVFTVLVGFDEIGKDVEAIGFFRSRRRRCIEVLFDFRKRPIQIFIGSDGAEVHSLGLCFRLKRVQLSVMGPELPPDVLVIALALF
jgi:hypothetical protein